VYNGKIHPGQVGGRYLCGEGDMIPTHMKIKILALVRFNEKPMGSTLRAQQKAFFHFGLPTCNSPGLDESANHTANGRLPLKQPDQKLAGPHSLRCRTGWKN
jgi:hypothetical protein